MKTYARLLMACMLIILIVFYSAFLTRKTDLANDDIGRHLTNGRLVFQDPKVLYTNYYSYTYPDFGFVNHHWLYGVLSYWLYLAGGFGILTAANAIVLLAAFLIMFRLAAKGSSLLAAFAVSLPVILVLTERCGIRPEAFSCLFMAAFIFITCGFLRKRTGMIWLLPLLEVAWVNMHIYFFLGPVVVIAFLLQGLAEKGRPVFRDRSFRTLAKVAVAVLAATLANPNGLTGALYPLLMQGNYGFSVLENQTPFMMLGIVPNTHITAYLFMLAAFAVAAICTIRQWRRHLGWMLLAALSIAMSLLMVRNLPLFGLISLPVICLAAERLKRRRRLYHSALAAFGLATAMILLTTPAYYVLPRYPGIGAVDGSEKAAEFFNSNNISGNIFNNYDIGGYVIFYHFPRVRPFVDNRPEAYPAGGFFSELYIPMQSDEGKWQDAMRRFNFSAIYFRYQELTTWGPPFLARRMNDSEWGAVYADGSCIILVRRDSYPGLYGNRITKENAPERLAPMLGSDDPDVATYGAYLLSLLGRSDLALQVFEKSAERYPGYIPSLMSLADIYGRSGDPAVLAKSVRYYEKAIAAGYIRSVAFSGLGMSCMKLGDYARARSAWNTALLLDPFNEGIVSYLKSLDIAEAAQAAGMAAASQGP